MTIKVHEVPISSLKEMPGNPRRITKLELKALARSMKQFGAVQPIVVYRSKKRPEHDGETIGGHQRIKAAKMLGWKTIPIINWRGPYHKAKALNVALNKIGGDWNVEKLTDFLADIEQHDVDLRDTGFTEEELSVLTEQMGTYDPKLVPGGNLGDVDVDDPTTNHQTREKRKVRCPKCHHKFQI
jgi:ParB-like chromosome segregation protein Spo0J